MRTGNRPCENEEREREEMRGEGQGGAWRKKIGPKK